MEVQHSEEINSRSFLQDKAAQQFFARVDYYLKSGGHIQRNYPKPSHMHRFVEKNFESLELYYKEFFSVNLIKQGGEFDSFYYIDFEERNRGKISQEYRQLLPIEIIIIGLLFLKFSKFDGHIDLERVSDFTMLLFTEYEEEKESLSKLILSSNSANTTDRDEEHIKKVVINAFKKFAELGWLYWEDDNDKFHILPSFERLRIMYEHQIMNIDDLIMRGSND